MLRTLNVPEWFSELSQSFIVHFGQPLAIPEDEVHDAPPTEEDRTTPVNALPTAQQVSIDGDVMLDSTTSLTKHKLIMSILGFFKLGLEFNSEILREFTAGLGSGRPFFSFFLQPTGAQMPPLQHKQSFEVGRECPHFRVLVEYFKFREVWKVFCSRRLARNVNHMQCTPFFEAVQKLIWSRISTDDPILRSIFLHTTVTATPGAASFADVLNMEMVVNNIDIQYLRSLDIHVGTHNTPRAHVSSSHRRSIYSFRDRLVLWVERIVGTAELIPVHAPLFVNLLVAAAKSAVMRAVLWLILPAPGAFQEGAGTTPGGIPVVVDQFIESLLTLANPASRLERFLSFLFVAEHPLKGAVHTASAQRAVGVGTYAETMSWADEIVWMDKYPQQTWSLSWGELNLMRTDTPYFSLQVLLRRVHQETNTSLQYWLELLTSMPKDIVSASFEADVKEAQIRLLFLLNHQRESLGNNETNRSGFSEMMVQLDMATLIPMSVMGDKMWRKLQLLFRPDGENTAGATSITVAGALKLEQNLTAFKKFMDHIAKWSAAFFGSDAPGGNSGGAFADLLIACLDNAVLRAVCMIVKPRRTNSHGDALDTAATSQRLKDILAAMNRQKGDCHLLYLLLQLGYKGIKKEEDGSLTITELSWADESEWLFEISQRSSWTLVFDSTDFALLTDPAYLLFRFVSKNCQTIGEGDTYRLVNNVLENLPKAVYRDFYAHNNYLPCRENQRVREGEAVKGFHFKYLLYYPLYNEMWKVIMSPLNDPFMDTKFAQAVVYATWLLVKSNANPHLSRMLLPLETDLKWEELTYLMAVQRYAIISVKCRGKVELSTLYPTLVIADNLTVSPDCIRAHTLLVNRIIKWVLLLGGQRQHMKETDAGLFMELFIAAAADVAIRAFLFTVEPAPSVVTDFMKSASYVPSNDDESPATTLCSASIMCVKLLADTFRRKGWQQFRSFLTVLNHPLRNAGTSHEIEPLWKDESKWIQERFKLKPATVSWQELEFVMTETPYIFLLLVTKAFPLEQQKAAIKAIPLKYLLDKFKANRPRLSDDVVCAPHFIVMCLHEATSALEVFQEHCMISDQFFDQFFEALLREVVVDPNFLLRAYRLLQRFLYKPNISSVLIKFLLDISKRENFWPGEKMIIGKLVLLVFQLESCSSDSTFIRATAPASKLMRGDNVIKEKVCLCLISLRSINFYSNKPC
jgi:hypothetical protein